MSEIEQAREICLERREIFISDIRYEYPNPYNKYKGELPISFTKELKIEETEDEYIFTYS